MQKERNKVIKRIMLVLDAIVITSVFILAFFFRKYFSGIYQLDFFPSVEVVKLGSLSLIDYSMVYVVLLVIWCVALSLNGMYHSVYIKSPKEIVWRVAKTAFFVMITFGTIAFTFRLQFVSRFFFIVFMIAVSSSLILEKMIIFPTLNKVLWRGYNRRRLLIVGTGPRAVKFMDKIESHPEWGYTISKIVDFKVCPLSQDGRQVMKKCEIAETPDVFSKILHRILIDEVIFVVPKSMVDRVQDYLYVCEEVGVDTAVAVDFFDVKGAKFHQTDMEGTPLITLEKTFGREWQLFVKRAFDVIISAVGIIMLSPLFFVTMILIKLTSPGSILFKQKRIGLRGRKFTMYKFRSMYKGAEKEIRKLEAQNEMKGPVFKMKDDPRITPLGRFLRKTSIDELPQLFNVFIGRLSLVGPRPALPRETSKYEPWQRRRLSVRPGITCLWQVWHRGEGDFEKWVKNDLEYVDNWSLWLDFKIFVRTLLVVLSGKGAY